MIRLSRLHAALIMVLITVTAIAVFGEILYVLWRRGILFRRSNTQHGRNQQDVEFAAQSKGFNPFMSKDLLRYFCFKNQSRIEPNEVEHASSSAASSSPSASETSSPTSLHDLDGEHLKWFGRPRLLFTIKEEESEGVDSENGSSVGNVSSSSLITKSFSFDAESFAAVAFDTARVTAKTLTEATILYMNETTPFSTPCASPPYLTPSSSPSRDVEYSTPGSWDHCDAFLLNRINVEK